MIKKEIMTSNENENARTKNVSTMQIIRDVLGKQKQSEVKTSINIREQI